jgi:hypothetical protein
MKNNLNHIFFCVDHDLEFLYTLICLEYDTSIVLFLILETNVLEIIIE